MKEVILEDFEALKALNDRVEHPEFVRSVVLSLPLQRLPPLISRFHRLEKLVLKKTQLQTLGVSAKKLKQLSSVYVYESPSIDYQQFFAELSAFSIHSLGLYFNEITHLPDNLSQLATLERLDIRQNAKIDINASLASMISLKELHFMSRRAEELPANICTLPNLEILQIEEGKGLRSIPRDFTLLSSLQKMRIYRSYKLNIHELVNMLSSLISLKLLGIQVQNIEFLPANLLQLRQLEKLELDIDEPFQKFPDFIHHLKHLNYLRFTFAEELPPQEERERIVANLPSTEVVFTTP